MAYSKCLISAAVLFNIAISPHRDYYSLLISGAHKPREAHSNVYAGANRGTSHLSLSNQEILSATPGGSGPEHPWTPRVLSALYTPKKVQCCRLPVALAVVHYL